MEYEPIYVVDYLRSYPTLVELWEENDALYKEMPSLSTEENRHLSNILQEYRECKEQMYKYREENLPQEYHQARKARNKKRKEVWDFCEEHELPNIIVSNGDKKGIQDLDGKPILPAIYDEFCMTHDAIEHIIPIYYYACRKDGKWGIVNNHNKVRVPFEYDRIFRLVNYPYMFYIEKDGRKGLVKLTPFEVYDDRGKRMPKQEETTMFVIPCEMDEIYFIEHKNLFVFRQPNMFLLHMPSEEYKYGWYWETSLPNPKSYSPCVYDELYIPVPWIENPISYTDDFFEARRGKDFDYILIWSHSC